MKALFTLCFLFLSTLIFAQTTNGNGTAWLTGANWAGGSAPGAYAPGSPNALSFTNQNIFINHPMIVGSFGTTTNMNFANSNFAGQFNVDDGVTFIVYGSMNFVNRAMDLVIGDNSTMIVLGNFDLGNQVIIATTGKLVVSGNFNKGGSQGSYSGNGAVYAGSYSGDANNFIPGDVATGSDQQQVIDDLLDDDLEDVWEFINNGGANPLPVELVTFQTTPASQGIVLKWHTATELNNDYFDIERSENAKDFYAIGRVNGNGTTTEPKTYTFTDNQPVAAISYYRLKQVDFDGAFEYSKIITGYTDKLASQMAIHVYPNPAAERLSFKSVSPVAFEKLVLISTSGQEIANLKPLLRTQGLQNEVALPAVKSGHYIVQYTTTDGASGTQRVIIK